MDVDWWQLIILAGVGVVSGFLNILAGGGSLLTLPLLIFIGLPAVEANGTNRVAIVVQNLCALRSYKNSGVLNWKIALMCALPAVIGAIIGSSLAVTIEETLFRQVLAVVMLLMLVVTAIDPVKRWRNTLHEGERTLRWPLLLGFFVIGLYGGFIQAGVGFLILMVTMMAGMDLVKGNVLKVVVVLIFNIPAVMIFAWHGQVDWLLGSVLASGNAVGAMVAARLAVTRGHEWIRRVVTLVIVACAVRLLVL